MSERCHFCGGPMVWDSDATGDDGELISYLHCTQCEARAEWTKREVRQ